MLKKRIFDKNKTGELIVKRRYSSRVKLFIVGLVVVTLIAAGGLLYNHGLSSAGFVRLSAIQRQKELRDEIKRLKDENQELRETVARAQRALQMDQVAYQELDRSLQESAKEIVKLREELTFYRNIISPANKVAGLQIQSLNIERTRLENQYRYKLVLVQALKHDRSVYGRARLEVNGLQEGKDAVLPFPAPNEKPININFKYFQDIEGVMKLPKDFKPMRIKVTVTTTGGSAQTLEQVYGWPKL